MAVDPAARGMCRTRPLPPLEEPGSLKRSKFEAGTPDAEMRDARVLFSPTTALAIRRVAGKVSDLTERCHPSGNRFCVLELGSPSLVRAFLRVIHEKAPEAGDELRKEACVIAWNNEIDFLLDQTGNQTTERVRLALLKHFQT